MKVTMKRLSATIGICLSLLLVGCSTGNEAGNSANEATAPAAKNEATSTPTPEPAQKELSLKEKGTIGDWEISVKKLSIQNKVKRSNGIYYQARKGKTYAVLSVTVKNNGKEDDTFLPYAGIKGKMLQALLVVQDKDEYKPTPLMGYSKDLATKKIKSSEKKSGIIVFEIPKKDGKNKKNLKFTIEKGDEKLLYSLAK